MTNQERCELVTKLHAKRKKLIIIQMVGVFIYLGLQLAAGLNKWLPPEILQLAILPMLVWCMLFLVLFLSVQTKIQNLCNERPNKNSLTRGKK